MNVHKRFKAKHEYSRVDHFLNESLPDISRSQLVRLLTEGHIQLNKNTITKKNTPIEINDVLDIELPEIETNTSEYTPSIDLQTLKLYEDDYILIIDKPTGISVHPGSGTKEETILDIFRANYPQIDDIDTGEENRPGIVHRLDKDTSGIMILAKDTRSMIRLQKQFKRHEVNKVYMALVDGHMRYRNGTIDEPIARHPKFRTKFKVVPFGEKPHSVVREAVTKYSVVKEFPNFSFVKLFPETGRTHQIRVHLQHHGAPVLGDSMYGKKKSFPRLALHAYALAFYHPITDQIIATYSPAPKIFRDFLKEQYSSL